MGTARKALGGRSLKRLPGSLILFACATFLCSVLTFSISVPSPSASAESVGSSTLSVRVKDIIAIRILDDTGTSSISTLGIDIAPTPNGSTVTKNAIVDVATSNETGYTLYMDSDYKEDGTSSSTPPETQSTYTTDLIHTDPTVTITIPSSVPSSSSDTNFWNYTTSWNDTIGTGSNTTTLTSSTSATVIPIHGTPDTIRDDVTGSTDSSMTTIGVNVNVNNDIPSGTYKNKLVFTAVANELPPALPDFWNITTMQEMTPEICSSVYTPNNTVSMTDEYIIDKSRALAGDYTVESDGTSPLVPEVTLLDDRDADGTGTKKSYKVRKLADGNCWTVENLAYDLVGLYNNGKRGIGSKNDGSTFEMTDANLATGVAGYYTTTANAYNYVINPNTKSLANIARSSYLGDVTGQTDYYYSWTAATAGQGSQTNASGTVDGSICPAGWRLPTGYTDTMNQNISWSALTNAYLGITTNTNTGTGYQTLEQYPINFYRAGHVASSTQQYAAYANYWASTAVDSDRTQSMLYSTSNVAPQNYYYKNDGYQIRCVANPAPPKTIWQIETMQEMTPAICATTTTPTSSATSLDTDGTHIGDTSYVPQTTLTDTRDENTYIVRKLADGNCWMSQNLRLGKYGESITLTPADSDVSSDYTIPASLIYNTVPSSWGSGTIRVVDRDSSQYGNWYNWYTATAGTGTTSMVNQNAPSSICPKSWKLPDNTGASSFQSVFDTYGISAASHYATLQSVPISFVSTGYINASGTTYYVGSCGYNWSSSAATTASDAYQLNYCQGYVPNAHYPYTKYAGFGVRCLAHRS